MAAGYLPAPGTEFGPCVEPCKHRDCAATRRDATSICQRCNQPIGYETAFYYRHPDTPHIEHAYCDMDA